MDTSIKEIQKAQEMYNKADKAGMMKVAG